MKITSCSRRDLRLLATELLYLVDKGAKSTQVKSIILEHQHFRRTNKDKPVHNYFNDTVQALSLITLMTFVMAFILAGWTYEEYAELMDQQIIKESCLLPSSTLFFELGRPLLDCQVCAGMGFSLPEVTSISPSEFLQKYAFSRKPVVVRTGAKQWKALSTFSYDWFRELYSKNSEIFQQQEYHGLFFSYASGLDSLEEALNMNWTRRNTTSWYFGWGNSVDMVSQILRDYYVRPSFLPSNSDSPPTDWIFMGTPHDGAVLHLDHVKRASWQAQITGQKMWTLIPPAECSHLCSPLNVTMSPGDILVVDTNYWFHKTIVLPGENSISIGSEYD